MESLAGTTWDVVIAGTGLQQSLLALSLSRSGKKVLHVDENRYYGGSEAAFSLQEAEEWLRARNDDNSALPSQQGENSLQPLYNGSENAPKLSSRAYSLSLSPQLLYSRSRLLQTLISSKVYRQLEFLAVGSWWVYVPRDASSTAEPATSSGELKKVPNGREDVFSDDMIDLRSKRSLMKFLKFVVDYENMSEVWSEHSSTPFPEFLSSRFGISPSLQAPLLALTLSPAPPLQTSTGFSLPRIARHLRSMGLFGPGFGAVLPKWGGGSEIAQVACRACAVGGGVYMLDQSIRDVSETHPEEGESHRQADSPEFHPISVTLSSGETVTTKWIVGSSDDILEKPKDGYEEQPGSNSIEATISRSISIVSSSLAELFPQTAEAGPVPAGAVVVFPSDTLSVEGQNAGNKSPVYIIVHSSDSGECPSGQCVLYSSTSGAGGEGQAILDLAVRSLLMCTGEDPTSCVQWSMRYTQQGPSPASEHTSSCTERLPGELLFPRSSVDLAYGDSLLDNVKFAYEKVMGTESESHDFMVFSDREAPGAEPSDEE